MFFFHYNQMPFTLRGCWKLLLWPGPSNETPQDPNDPQPTVELRPLQKNGDICKYRPEHGERSRKLVWRGWIHILSCHCIAVVQGLHADSHMFLLGTSGGARGRKPVGKDSWGIAKGRVKVIERLLLHLRLPLVLCFAWVFLVLFQSSGNLSIENGKCFSPYTLTVSYA